MCPSRARSNALINTYDGVNAEFAYSLKLVCKISNAAVISLCDLLCLQVTLYMTFFLVESSTLELAAWIWNFSVNFGLAWLAGFC